MFERKKDEMDQQREQTRNGMKIVGQIDCKIKGEYTRAGFVQPTFSPNRIR